jgi:hypothetical protein
VAVLYCTTLLLSVVFSTLVLRTPLRWVIGGPVRAEQRARLDAQARATSAAPAVPAP